MDSTKRYDKKQKYVQVERPASVWLYNKHKGGIDVNHFMHRIKIKSKKWSVKVIFHFTDLALVNTGSTTRRIAKRQAARRAKCFACLTFGCRFRKL